MDFSEMAVFTIMVLGFGWTFWHLSSQQRDKEAVTVCTVTATAAAAPLKTTAAPRDSSKRVHTRKIGDDFKTVAEVRSALRKSGLESSALILGVDFTKSNTWTGENSFAGKCLHTIDEKAPNPYQVVISSLGRGLSDLDEEQQVPAYGFGDIKTKDHSVFPFRAGEPCAGLDDALQMYAEHANTVKMSGPTSFAPIIREALAVQAQKGGYHVLIIIADGQVTDERDTVDAIVEASSHPLSIVVVGVGDGPWDMMQEFDDMLPQRNFDNFQFVEYTAVQASASDSSFDACLALACLQELPEQYAELRRQGLLRQSKHAGGSKLTAVKASSMKQSSAGKALHEAEVNQGGKVAASNNTSTGIEDPVWDSAPDNYECPITNEVMEDPVMAEDGYTYERAAIQQWFASRTSADNTAPSPMSNRHIDLRVIPNNALRSEIMEWKEKQKGANRNCSVEEAELPAFPSVPGGPS